MCNQLHPISKNVLGSLTFCPKCKVFQLNFNNLFFELSAKDLNRLRDFLNNTDVDYWEEQENAPVWKRKIPVPTQQENLILLFNKQEFALFKQLLSNTSRDRDYPLSILDIDYTLILN